MSEHVGQPLCPRCQCSNPTDAIFCAYCGHALAPGQQDATERRQADTHAEASISLPEEAITRYEEPMPLVAPTPTASTASVPSAPETPQVSLPASAPGTPTGSSLAAKSTLGKAASGFLQTALGKVIISVVAVAIVATAAVRVVPILAHGVPGTQATQAKDVAAPRKTEPMPATQTECPATGKAHPMVKAYLAQGTNANLVYYETLSGAPVLKRYDTQTRQSNTILALPQEKV
ncbi:zinc ribbon domain-containing protein [Ktedonobacter racemifer]|nr:zinc ribbon domain-containing protein [Ktedonobacter racemifer]